MYVTNFIDSFQSKALYGRKRRFVTDITLSNDTFRLFLYNCIIYKFLEMSLIQRYLQTKGKKRKSRKVSFERVISATNRRFRPYKVLDVKLTKKFVIYMIFYITYVPMSISFMDTLKVPEIQHISKSLKLMCEVF